MAIGDAYASAAYYQARNTGGSSVSDATRLGEDLIGASRAFDFECGLAPGTMNDVSGLTLYFDALGGARLDFRDDRSLLWLVRSIDEDGIGVDSEDDGTYDGYTLDLEDAWVEGFPANNAVVGKPYEGIELLTYLRTCNPSAWPNRKRAIRLNCTIGYSTIPDSVKIVVCDATRQIRDAAGAGAIAEMQRFEDVQQFMTQDTWRQIQRMKNEFRRSLPVVA